MKKYISVYCNGTMIADRIENGNTFFKRFIGLMGRAELQDNQGCYLSPCNSIHTFSMRFPIDVLFLSKEGIVLEIESRMKPWHVKPIVLYARSVLELTAGSAEQHGISTGDRIIFQPS